ncbi:hypothetical protein BpHYR1_010578 [Brachionus plicatilis]|uniref:Uncharacterized protein n=1 Tax=Brachionus plicatilis TaxID=10195 RepID=A0A3M7QJH7_BRAPC|nr:hypothetical protein BpHYR1_010578 [Brachionus plicatilis]
MNRVKKLENTKNNVINKCNKLYFILYSFNKSIFDTNKVVASKFLAVNLDLCVFSLSIHKKTLSISNSVDAASDTSIIKLDCICSLSKRKNIRNKHREGDQIKMIQYSHFYNLLPIF